jgi:hypothetical protein
MEATQSVIELVADAQAKAKASEQRVAEIETLIAQQGASEDASEELHALLSGMEAAVVDIYSLFESRMQRNFKRGPFSRKLKALLMEAKNPDLADRVHQYYLAVNVLKHGTGASYRELVASPSSRIVTKPVGGDGEQSTSLIDVSGIGFFDGLAEAILDACAFLEKR